jgi:hypothetical protein
MKPVAQDMRAFLISQFKWGSRFIVIEQGLEVVDPNDIHCFPTYSMAESFCNDMLKSESQCKCLSLSYVAKLLDSSLGTIDTETVCGISKILADLSSVEIVNTELEPAVVLAMGALYPVNWVRYINLLTFVTDYLVVEWIRAEEGMGRTRPLYQVVGGYHSLKEAVNVFQRLTIDCPSENGGRILLAGQFPGMVFSVDGHGAVVDETGWVFYKAEVDSVQGNARRNWEISVVLDPSTPCPLTYCYFLRFDRGHQRCYFLNGDLQRVRPGVTREILDWRIWTFEYAGRVFGKK